MGLFKSIKKGISKVWKGVKKVFKKVGKALKKVVASKWFKIGMLALSVWTMGTAAGLIGTGGSGAGAGAAAAGEAAGTAAGEAATQAATAAATEGATQAATTAATDLATTAASEGATQALASGLPGPAGDVIGTAATQGAPVVTSVGVPGAGGTVAGSGGGLIGKAANLAVEGAKSFGSTLADNPGLTSLAGNVISSVTAPDPYEEQMKYEEEQRKKGNVFGVLGTGETQGQLLDPGKFTTSQRQNMATRAQQNQGIIARAQELSEALQPTAPRQFGQE